MVVTGTVVVVVEARVGGAAGRVVLVVDAGAAVTGTEIASCPEPEQAASRTDSRIQRRIEGKITGMTDMGIKPAALRYPGGTATALPTRRRAPVASVRVRLR